MNCFWLLADCPPASVLAQYYFRKVGSAAGPKSADETRIGAIFTGGRLSFPPPPNSIAPETIESHSPCGPRRSLVPSHLPSVDAARFSLIVAFFMMFSSRFRRRRILIFIFFVASFSVRLRNPPPPTHTFRHGRAPSPVPPLAASLILWFIVALFLLAAS